jgi:hypothetical protein
VTKIAVYFSRRCKLEVAVSLRKQIGAAGGLTERAVYLFEIEPQNGANISDLISLNPFKSQIK